MLSQYSVPTFTSGSESDSQTGMTAVVTGGIVAVVFITTIAVVTVVLLKNRKGHNPPSPQKK